VAVGDSFIYYSNGTTPSGFSKVAANWLGTGKGISWDPNRAKWIATGSTGVGYSSDAVTWTVSTDAVIGANANFSGAAVTGIGASGLGTNTIGYSANGIKWAASSSATNLLNMGCYALAWNGHAWVAGGISTGASNIIYSIDGINWVYKGGAVLSGSCLGAAWNGGRWVVVGTGSSPVAYSDNSTVWSNGTATGICTTSGNCVAWNGVRWVMGGIGGNTMAYSTGGITWTTASNTLTTGCLAVAWNGTLWVAGGSGTDTIIRSTAGITWTASTSPFSGA
jgi:hypothetical protein